jgi:hypothetical protein
LGPIPNPQSPIPNPSYFNLYLNNYNYFVDKIRVILKYIY